MGVNLLFSDTTGKVTHVVNSTCLTAIRTAAGSLLSSVLALGVVKDKVKRMVVFGDGAQAIFHLWLHVRYFASIEKVVVAVGTHRELTSDQLKEKESTFLNHLSSLSTSQLPNLTFINAKTKHIQVQQAVDQAQLILTCTPSTQPLFTNPTTTSGKEKGKMHICAVGSYKPIMCELPPDLIRQVSKEGKLFVDSVEACVEEAGCLLQALGVKELKERMVEIATLLPSTEAGNGGKEQEWLNELEKRAEMWNKMQDHGKGQGQGGRISVFKSVGVGLQDVEMTKLVVAVGGDGVGCVVPF